MSPDDSPYQIDDHFVATRPRHRFHGLNRLLRQTFPLCGSVRVEWAETSKWPRHPGSVFPVRRSPMSFVIARQEVPAQRHPSARQSLERYGIDDGRAECGCGNCRDLAASCH